MGGATLSKSLIQFSVDGRGCVPSLLFDLRPGGGGGGGYEVEVEVEVEVVRIMATSFSRSCTHCCTQCPRPCSRPPQTHASTGDSWTLTGKSGSVSCGVTAPFSWVLVGTRFCLCPSKSLFSPVLCKFWRLCGGVNGNLLQEGLCHTQVCSTQSPCPYSSPLLTRTSTVDTQTQFCLSLWGLQALVCTRFV